jgi:membrane protein implicated in regulation of membrane protease activity
MFNVVVGIIWQTALTATGIFLVIEAWTYLLVSVAVTVVTSVVLKYNWYDKMENHPKDLQLSAD